jgi:hypothetical protein
METNNEECLELKNIKYKTMLLKGVAIKETKSSNNMLNLENFLENEKNNNKNEPWCKLNKTIKIQKLIEFVELYKTENKLNEEEENLLITFFRDCLERKKLQRVKDVIYDKDTGTVKNIPALHYTKSTKHFTLKNNEKRVSTLKSLAPKKINTTIKNKNILNNKENALSDNENSDNDN